MNCLFGLRLLLHCSYVIRTPYKYTALQCTRNTKCEQRKARRGQRLSIRNTWSVRDPPSLSKGPTTTIAGGGTRLYSASWTTGVFHDFFCLCTNQIIVSKIFLCFICSSSKKKKNKNCSFVEKKLEGHSPPFPPPPPLEVTPTCLPIPR
jgi:hypothetical protein